MYSSVEQEKKYKILNYENAGNIPEKNKYVIFNKKVWIAEQLMLWKLIKLYFYPKAN